MVSGGRKVTLSAYESALAVGLAALALLVATMAACQSSGPNGPKDALRGNEDVVDTLAALLEAEMPMSSTDGAPQFIVGEFGKIDTAQDAGLVASDASLACAAAMFPHLLRHMADRSALVRGPALCMSVHAWGEWERSRRASTS